MGVANKTLAALLLLGAATACEGEYTSHRFETIYHFDSGKPVSWVALDPADKDNRSIVNPNPTYGASEYHALAVRVMSDFGMKWQEGILVDVEAQYQGCSQGRRISQMSFKWSLPLRWQQGDLWQREFLRISIDGQYGNIRAWYETRHNVPPDSVPLRPVDYSRLETIIQHAIEHAAVSENKSILTASDCWMDIHTVYGSPLVYRWPLKWQVAFDSQSAKKRVTITIDPVDVFSRPVD